MFMGNCDIGLVMVGTKFKEIHKNIHVYPFYGPHTAAKNTQWYSKVLLVHLDQNAASLTIPTGVTSLDENEVNYKGRPEAQ